MFGLLLGASSTFAAASSDQAAVYGALPFAVEAEISPDGRTVAVLHNADGIAAVFFHDLDNPDAKPTGVNAGVANARSIEWAGDDYLLLRLSQSDQIEGGRASRHTAEIFRWISISRKTLLTQMLLPNEGAWIISSSGSLLSTLPGDPEGALFAKMSQRGLNNGNRYGGRVQDAELAYSLLKANLKTGETIREETGGSDTVDWIVNRAGEAVARIDRSVGGNRRIFARPSGASRLKSAFTLEGEDDDVRATNILALNETGDRYIGATYSEDNKRILAEFDQETGAFIRPLFTHPRYDTGDFDYDPRTATITGVRYTDDLPRTYYLDAEIRNAADALSKALPGAGIAIPSKSADGRRMVVKAVYSDRPTQFFIYDKEARRVELIASAFPTLDGAEIAKKEKYNYVTSDGLTIDGYLTVPAGASKTKMPLIVLPHGGPESRSDQAFDYWAFFYAAHGYLVYEPNFRGSQGYGYEFRSAGYGEWGRKMQDDITEGVKKLIGDSVVDPDRICIVGGSYGGYAALAGATLTPELFACAVSVNGVADLSSMLGQSARRGDFLDEYWSRRIGNRFKDTDAIRAVSPRHIAAQAGPPIMLIHSKDDLVVPVDQSENMARALKEANKPYEFHELEGEDHWLSSSETRTEMLRLSIDFIDRNIGR